MPVLTAMRTAQEADLPTMAVIFGRGGLQSKYQDAREALTVATPFPGCFARLEIGAKFWRADQNT